jgi:hypothetical protein
MWIKGGFYGGCGGMTDIIHNFTILLARKIYNLKQLEANMAKYIPISFMTIPKNQPNALQYSMQLQHIITHPENTTSSFKQYPSTTISSHLDAHAHWRGRGEL